MLAARYSVKTYISWKNQYWLCIESDQTACFCDYLPELIKQILKRNQCDLRKIQIIVLFVMWKEKVTYNAKIRPR